MSTTCEDCGNVDDCDVQKYFNECHRLMAEKIGDMPFEFKLTISDDYDCPMHQPMSPCCGENLDEDIMLCPVCKEHC